MRAQKTFGQSATGSTRRWRLAFSRFPQVFILHQRRRPPRDESRNNQPHRLQALILSGGSVNNACTANIDSAVGIAPAVVQPATQPSSAASMWGIWRARTPAPARSRSEPKASVGTASPRDTAPKTDHECSRTSRTSTTSLRAAASVRGGAVLNSPTDSHHERTSSGDFNNSLSSTGFDRLKTVLVRSSTGWPPTNCASCHGARGRGLAKVTIETTLSGCQRGTGRLTPDSNRRRQPLNTTRSNMAGPVEASYQIMQPRIKGADVGEPGYGGYLDAFVTKDYQSARNLCGSG